MDKDFNANDYRRPDIDISLKNLGLALIGTPATVFIGLIVVTLIGALDEAITAVQLSGHWWFILIGGYLVSLIYFLCLPIYKRSVLRSKFSNALVLYYREKLSKDNKTKILTDSEAEVFQKLFIERIKIWAWEDPDLWSKYFPNEKYSKHLFGIIDNFINAGKV